MFTKLTALFISTCLMMDILSYPAYARLMLIPPSLNEIKLEELGDKSAGLNGLEPKTTKRVVPVARVFPENNAKSFNEIIAEEVAVKKNISVQELESDFEKGVSNLEAKIKDYGFISPSDDEISFEIHNIFSRLAKAYERTAGQMPGNFHLVDWNATAAFVIRKRNDVYFYKGLYELMYDIADKLGVKLTKDAVAFIIAHELAHRLQKTSVVGFNTENLDFSQKLHTLQLIRNAEYDADSKALELMDKAGFSVFGAVEAFELLEFIEQSRQAENTLTSHPYITLRKHRVSEIIYDQKTNIFKNAKPQRNIMPGNGRLKSVDADFRNLLYKSEDELTAMAREAKGLPELNELASMLIARRKMNALKMLVNDEELKSRFIKKIFLQAVLTALNNTLDGEPIIPGWFIRFENMKLAGSIVDFGAETKKDAGQVKKTSEMDIEVDGFIENFGEGVDIVNNPAIRELISSATKTAKELDNTDFEGFLLPAEEVEDLRKVLFGFIELDKEGNQRQKNLNLLMTELKNPKKIISAFIYASAHSAQALKRVEPIDEDIKLYKLKPKCNSLYCEDPGYRSVETPDQRRNLENVLLIHCLLKDTVEGIFTEYFGAEYASIREYLKMPASTVVMLFESYYKLFLEKFQKREALSYALYSLKNILRLNIEAYKELDLSISNKDPDYKMGSFSVGTTPSGYSGLFETLRAAEAGELFNYETNLGFFGKVWLDRLKHDLAYSYDELTRMPEWKISDIVNGGADIIEYIILEELQNALPMESLVSFMKNRLTYDDRKTVFNKVLRGKYKLLYEYFKNNFDCEPQKIKVWFLELFKESDAIELIQAFVKEYLYRQYKNTDNPIEAKWFREFAISLLETAFNHSAKFGDPEMAKIYLDMVKGRLKDYGEINDEEKVKEGVYQALLILSGLMHLTIPLSRRCKVSATGAPDFKSNETSINADSKKIYYESKFQLHNYSWCDEAPVEQSVFISRLPYLSIPQLKNLLKSRARYINMAKYTGPGGVVVNASNNDDFFANIVALILIKKLKNPEWGKNLKPDDALNELMSIVVHFDRDDKLEWKVGYTIIHLNFNEDEIATIPLEVLKEHVAGVVIPSPSLDPLFEKYIVKNRFFDRISEFEPMLMRPESTVNLATLFNHGGKRINYKNIISRLYVKLSAYSKIFNGYCKNNGKGYVYGKFKPLDERLRWLEKILPQKTIIKDSIIDLWETDIFPEIISGIPLSVKLAKQASMKEEGFGNILLLLGEMDDEVGRIESLNQQLNLPPERIKQLLSFYMRVMPLLLTPQKIIRYGATAYKLWEQLSGNFEADLKANLDVLVKFMPEPSVMRDEILFNIARKSLKGFADLPVITGLFYENNLVSPNKDLRREDFVTETLLHLFGDAKMKARSYILLWLTGAADKPLFVGKLESRCEVDFSTLPFDIRFLPMNMREKFLEGFMLGDNGVLDPLNEHDSEVMADFLRRIFLHIFPKGCKGIDEEARSILSTVFVTAMHSFPPYRRVQVIKSLADLALRRNFNKTATGERLSVLLGAMGPVGIKVAQYLSENETLVPDGSIRSSLGALRDKAPGITKISAFSVLENEVPFVETVVREVGDPAGEASIKQVYRGRWLDVNTLAELTAQKANDAESDEIKRKLKGYQEKEVSFGEIVEYLTEKARTFDIDPEEAVVNVVYKVRRPNIEVIIKSDFKAMDEIALKLKGAKYKGEAVNMVDLVQTVKEWVELEMHFENEVKFNNMITGLDYKWAREYEINSGLAIVHPRIFYATDSLIVEEEIQGVALKTFDKEQQKIVLEEVVDAGYSRVEADNAFEELAKIEPRKARIMLSLKKAGYSQKRLEDATDSIVKYEYQKLRDLLRRMLLRQMLVDGVFHADLHQGNVLLTPEGFIAMIDRGNAGTLNKKQRDGAKIFLKGLALREKHLIIQGVEEIFSNAEYPKGVGVVSPGLTVQDVEEILDKRHDLKMTMNLISKRSIRGAKNTQGGKDFSTFAKAFTQAMYLFPTDIFNGAATLQVLAEYISLDKVEVERAAVEQASCMQFDDSDASEGSNKSFTQTTKRLFRAKTEKLFLGTIWGPAAVWLITLPIKITANKIGFELRYIFDYVKKHQGFLQDKYLQEFAKQKNSDFVAAAVDILPISEVEDFITGYIKSRLGKNFPGRFFAPLAIIPLKIALFFSRPVTRFYMESIKEFDDRPSFTVREVVAFLAEYLDDSAHIANKFDKISREIRKTDTAAFPQAEPVEEPQGNLTLHLSAL